MNQYPPDPHVEMPPLPPEPPTRRIRQYGLLFGLAVLAVVFTVWVIYSYAVKQNEAKQNAAAAHKLCRQLNNVGQPCATREVGAPPDGVSGDAALPAPTASLEGTPVTPSRRGPTDPLRTDEQGIPQAFQPSEGALIVAVNVAEGRLVLTFDDGARVDAGPVNEDTLAFVLKAVSASPSPSPSPVIPSFPMGADGPDPVETGVRPTPEESPS